MKKTKKKKENNQIDTAGLDELFDTPVISNNELKLSEASQKYKVTERTILRWLKEGRLMGYKSNGVHGIEWRITGESDKCNNILPDEDKSISAFEDASIIDIVDQELSSNSDASLLAIINKLTNQLETAQNNLQAASYRNGWLEAQLQVKDEQLKLLEDKEAKLTEAPSPMQQNNVTWWKKFMRFLFLNPNKH
ncbi:MAG: helix-turn-helix domain-containing protein [Candidatus Parvarchaeum sp.]